jgi:type IV pilus assembly protein PilV
MRKNEQSGFTMIEVLVTIAILVVGLLGLAAMQTLATLAELEAYQRSQAVVLVRDMADRMNANKSSLPAYALPGELGTLPMNCAALVSAALDRCEWNNLLNGNSEKADSGTRNVGAMIGARGCIVRIDAQTYMVTIAWQGLSRAGMPVETCGQGAYGNDENRRTVSTIIRLALLAA